MSGRTMLFLLLFACGATGGLHAQSLFWLETTFGSPKLGSANTDGSNVHALSLAAGSLPEGLALSPGGSEVYWSELAFAGARIMTAHSGLTGIAALDTGGSAGRGVAFDSAGAKLYWSSSNLLAGGMILRADPDGSHKEVLQSFSPGTENPRALAVDHQGGRVYWTDYDGGMIRRAGLTAGAIPETLLVGLKGPVGLALDLSGGKMYWTEAGARTIKRANLDGSAVVKIDSNLAVPNYIALDIPRGAMYWTDLGTPGIWKANITGAQVQNLGITVSHPAGIAVVPGTTTSLSGVSPEVPLTFVLSQNFPNPFNPSTIIRYGLPGRSNVRLALFNALGQLVETLVDETQDAGAYQVRFNAASLASGVYFYRIQAGSFTSTKHLVVLR